MSKTIKILCAVLFFIYAARSPAEAILDDGTQLSESPIWIATYIEADADSVEQVEALLERQMMESREDTGNLGFVGLQRIHRDNHFAILEVWADAEAHSSHIASTHTKQFRTALEPLLYAPYDERIHMGLSATDPASISSGDRSSVYVLTHADLIRPAQFSPCSFGANPDSPCGNQLLTGLAQASRHHKGNIRFDILTQSDRFNHMTVLEIWGSTKEQQQHQVHPDKKAFRYALTGREPSNPENANPQIALNRMLGSLWDERLYQIIELRSSVLRVDPSGAL